MIDIDTMSNYRSFLDQVKDLGMTKSKFNYILATIVICLIISFLRYFKFFKFFVVFKGNK